MQPRSFAWFASTVLAALVLALTGWYGRGQLQRRTTQHAARRFRQELQTLPERRAARRIGQVPAADGQWLEVLVAAWADSRREVAASARAAVLSEIESWSQPPEAAAEPPLADLARLLAVYAPRMNGVEREAARALAERLLQWPADSRRLDAAGFIANCEAVLELPPTPPDELRFALSPAPRGSPPAIGPLQPEAVGPPAAPAPPQPFAPPAALPLPLADANRETPLTPRPFSAPQAIRISDD